jgi:hypothetical protein
LFGYDSDFPFQKTTARIHRTSRTREPFCPNASCGVTDHIDIAEIEDPDMHSGLDSQGHGKYTAASGKGYVRTVFMEDRGEASGGKR